MPCHAAAQTISGAWKPGTDRASVHMPLAEAGALTWRYNETTSVHKAILPKLSFSLQTACTVYPWCMVMLSHSSYLNPALFVAKDVFIRHTRLKCFTGVTSVMPDGTFTETQITNSKQEAEPEHSLTTMSSAENVEG